MVSRDDAAVALSHAAASYHEGGYPSTVGPEFEALSRAACDWARFGFADISRAIGPNVRHVSELVRGDGERSGLTVPFGKNKGRPIEETDDKDLRYLSTAMQRSIDDEAKARFKESNAKLKAAIDNELATRGAL